MEVCSRLWCNWVTVSLKLHLSYGRHVSACFSCCTETGLRIYHVEPLGQQEKFGELSLILH